MTRQLTERRILFSLQYLISGPNLRIEDPTYAKCGKNSTVSIHQCKLQEQELLACLLHYNDLGFESDIFPACGY
jgi:hypothetical protein